MAIKKLKFAFEVPITALLGLIAAGNTGLKIEVIGDDREMPPHLLNGHGMKLLEGPKPALLEGPKKRYSPKPLSIDARPSHKTIGDTPSWQQMLRAFARNPEHTKTAADLKKLIVSIGLMETSMSPQLAMMKNSGLIRSLSTGVYQLTAKGVATAEKLGFHVAGTKSDTKPKPKDKPKPKSKPDKKKPKTKTPEETVTEEPSHG